MRNPLASLTGITLVTHLLLESGALSPCCGFGTRVTSKRWARCKKCGGRVVRRGMDSVADEIKAKLAVAAPVGPEGAH